MSKGLVLVNSVVVCSGHNRAAPKFKGFKLCSVDGVWVKDVA